MKSEILQSAQLETGLAASLSAPVPEPSTPTLGQDIASVLRNGIYAIRARLGMRGLMILAAATVAAGLALNWSWVVAIGLAPILLAVLPCAAMCALGLCMMPKGEAASRRESSPDAAANDNISRSDRQDL